VFYWQIIHWFESTQIFPETQIVARCFCCTSQVLNSRQETGTMSKSNESSKRKEFESVTPMPLTDTGVGTAKDIVSSDDELLQTIGYKQVSRKPILY
jgi:hypothetical protein